MAITYHAGRRVQGTSTDVAVIASRGTITTDGSDTVIKFTGDGTFTPTSSFNVEYLVVAGGGQGGQSNAGGGGAGGYLTGTGHGVTAQDYSISVGVGGTSAGSISLAGTNGGNSSFSSFTSIGGGGGGSESANSNGVTGGSGGGGNGYSSGSGGSATAGQGYAGGNGTQTNGWRGGGGGGSASAGQTTSQGGVGGSGTQNDILITSTNVYYSAGGGGGGYTTSGAGGTGGGGNGSHTTVGGHATTYGSGGGGSKNGGGTNAGGNGFQGIVIIRFPTSGNTYETSLGGKPTNVQVGSRLEETDTRKMYHYEPELSLTGLKAHYDFSQTSGNLLNVATNTDSLGSSGDLTTTGTITKTAGAWVFGGGSAQNTTNALPSTFTAFTMNMWIQPNANNTSGYALVLSSVDGNTNNFSTINGSSSGKWQPTVGAYSGTESISYTTSNMDSSAFQMVTLVYNGALSGTARTQTYFNGSAEGTPTATPVANATASSKICVAIQGNSGQTPIFLGTYKDVSIWDRALTGSEITKLYNAGTAISPSGILAWKEEGT
jgi:hypothetical protein